MSDTWESRMAARTRRRLEIQRTTEAHREAQRLAAQREQDRADALAAQEAEWNAGPPHHCLRCWHWAHWTSMHYPEEDRWMWHHCVPDRADAQDGYFLCACECHGGDLYVEAPIVIA